MTRMIANIRDADAAREREAALNERRADLEARRRLRDQLCESYTHATAQYADHLVFRRAAEAATRLWPLAAALGKNAVRRCNEPLTAAEEKALDEADMATLEKAAKLVEFFGVTKVTGPDDPRGCALFLHLAHGAYNTLGGSTEGWGICP